MLPIILRIHQPPLPPHLTNPINLFNPTHLSTFPPHRQASARSLFFQLTKLVTVTSFFLLSRRYCSRTLHHSPCSHIIHYHCGLTPHLLSPPRQYTASTNSYTSTGITLSSAAFDVTLGPPYKLVVDTPAGGAAAGGEISTNFTYSRECHMATHREQ